MCAPGIDKSLLGQANALVQRTQTYDRMNGTYSGAPTLADGTPVVTNRWGNPIVDRSGNYYTASGPIRADKVIQGFQPTTTKPTASPAPAPSQAPQPVSTSAPSPAPRPPQSSGGGGGGGGGGTTVITREAAATPKVQEFDGSAGRRRSSKLRKASGGNTLITGGQGVLGSAPIGGKSLFGE